MVELDEPEAGRPALYPLETVHQRPMVVAHDRIAALNCMPHVMQIRQKVTGALVVVTVGSAVLRDIDGKVELYQPLQAAHDTLRVELPMAAVEHLEGPQIVNLLTQESVELQEAAERALDRIRDPATLDKAIRILVQKLQMRA